VGGSPVGGAASGKGRCPCRAAARYSCGPGAQVRGSGSGGDDEGAPRLVGTGVCLAGFGDAQFTKGGGGGGGGGGVGGGGGPPARQAPTSRMSPTISCRCAICSRPCRRIAAQVARARLRSSRVRRCRTSSGRWWRRLPASGPGVRRRWLGEETGIIHGRAPPPFRKFMFQRWSSTRTRRTKRNGRPPSVLDRVKTLSRGTDRRSRWKGIPRCRVPASRSGHHAAIRQHSAVSPGTWSRNAGEK